jgi:hypothetical protein
LKRLIPEKPIEGKQSVFLAVIWLKLALAWQDFEKLCAGFEKPNRRSRSSLEKTQEPRVAKSRLNSQIRARSAPALRRVGGCFSKTIIAAGQEAARPAKVEYRL